MVLSFIYLSIVIPFFLAFNFWYRLQEREKATIAIVEWAIAIQRHYIKEAMNQYMYKPDTNKISKEERSTTFATTMEELITNWEAIGKS